MIVIYMEERMRELLHMPTNLHLRNKHEKASGLMYMSYLTLVAELKFLTYGHGVSLIC